MSCGKNLSASQEIRIVQPETCSPCPPGVVGEIWLRSPSVAGGYWNNAPETTRLFHARIVGKESESYLRTGDLGFLHNGELYITGRIKNLVISEGKNHYPHDIERTATGAHAAISPAGCAAFSIATEVQQEQLVLIAEVRANLIENRAEIIRAIRQAVSEQHGLRTGDILLTLPGSIPRTTSGKIKHFLCKQQYLDGTLNQIPTT